MIVDEKEIARLMSENREKRRGHADYFSWRLDRDLEEGNVVNELLQSLRRENINDLHAITIRGRGKDPPDCEALDTNLKRVALEVTEFVDSDALRAARNNQDYLRTNEWTEEEFFDELNRLLQNKAKRREKLLGAPYAGGYRVIVFCDELELDRQKVSAFLDKRVFELKDRIDRAYLLLSYDPRVGYCPVFDIMLD